MPPKVPNALAQILPRRERKSLGALQVYPENVFFNSQDPGESIYILTRSHIAINTGWVIKFIFSIILPIIFTIGLEVFNSILVNRGIDPLGVRDLLPVESWLMVFLLYYSLALSYAIANFIDWYFDIYLVSNLRILHVDLKVFTGKSVAEAALVNIEDVSQSVVGFLPSFFNYGDVLVQTAAEKTKFNLKALPDPSWFRDVITDLSNLAKHSKHGNFAHATVSTTSGVTVDNNLNGDEP